MIDYIIMMLSKLPEDMGGEAASPAADHLFVVNEIDPEKLDEATAQLFHHYVAKLLFLDGGGFSLHTCEESRRG